MHGAFEGLVGHESMLYLRVELCLLFFDHDQRTGGRSSTCACHDSSTSRTSMAMWTRAVIKRMPVSSV